MSDSHLETTLLHSCLALPKVTYVLCTSRPSYIEQAARDFDEAVRETLQIIVGVPLSEWSWLKASLSSSRGGIGLRSASLHAPAAFLASSTSSQELIGKMLGRPLSCSTHMESAVTALSSSASKPDWLCLEDIDVPISQHFLSLAIDKAVHQHLFSSAPSTRARTLAHSSALPHASDWLNSVPSAALGLHLQDQEFRYCLRYWLGVPLHSISYSWPDCCSTADVYGDHQVGCGGNGDRIARHNAIRNVLFSAAQSVALAPTREAPSLFPDSHSRPADILLLTWSRGCPAALDVHVISPLQQLTLHEAASTPGHALQVGVRHKLTSHLSACRFAGVDFIPVVAETLGGLAEDTIFIIRFLGEAIAQRSTPEESSTCCKQLFHRVAVTLWRGNASLWLYITSPLSPPLLMD